MKVFSYFGAELTLFKILAEFGRESTGKGREEGEEGVEEGETEGEEEEGEGGRDSFRLEVSRKERRRTVRVVLMDPAEVNDEFDAFADPKGDDVSGPLCECDGKHLESDGNESKLSSSSFLCILRLFRSFSFPAGENLSWAA
jgi:hypothetical protein